MPEQSTRGKTAALYEGEFPDGTSFSKRTFHADAPNAYALVFRPVPAGPWKVAGVHQRESDYPAAKGSVWVSARRIG